MGEDRQPDGGSRGEAVLDLGELVDEYRKYIAGMREDSSGRPIYPSDETQSDVRQIFGRRRS